MKSGTWVCIFLMAASGVLAQTRVFTGATIHPVKAPVIQNGVLITEGETIAAMGAAGTLQIPEGAEIIDCKGKVIIPGLVDTHSHLGQGDGGDGTSALNPDVRILDSVDPQSDTFMRARAGGITTVNVMPGSGHLMSGQTVYLKMRFGKTAEDLLIHTDDTRTVYGGMKMANGTNSMRTSGPFPGTRSKSAAMMRDLFVRAQDYKKKLDQAGSDASKRPARDLQMESMLEILNGKRIVHFHTHRHDDIMTAIRLSKEFQFKVVLHHVSEGWMVAGEIARAGIPSSIIVIDSPGGKLEAANLSPRTGAILDSAGARVAFHTDDPITDSRLFLRSAAMAVRFGMNREKALEGLTIAGAEMLGLEKKVGSLAPGKSADLVILSGDPFSVYTTVEQTWVEGKKVFDRQNPADKAYATGGYQIYRDLLYDHHDLGGGHQ
ncbi:MAG: amidohydrolase family protein [Bacteroidetes bacterium]|nr:amidohydrolase family protein [Bacteroidota bacterium]